MSIKDLDLGDVVAHYWHGSVTVLELQPKSRALTNTLVQNGRGNVIWVASSDLRPLGQ